MSYESLISQLLQEADQENLAIQQERKAFDLKMALREEAVAEKRVAAKVLERRDRIQDSRAMSSEILNAIQGTTSHSEIEIETALANLNLPAHIAA